MAAGLQAAARPGNRWPEIQLVMHSNATPSRSAAGITDPRSAAYVGAQALNRASLPQNLLVAALTLPWLWPLAIGPWPAVLPWLVSMVGGVLALLMAVWLRVDMPRAIVTAWLLAAVLSSGLGLLQYFGLSPALAPFVNTTPLGEAFANLRQRNQFASLTSIGMVTVVAWLLLAGKVEPFDAAPAPASNGLRGWRWHLAWGATVLLAVANAASSSRTGLMQLGLLVLLYGVWGKLRLAQVRMLLLVAGLAYGAAALLLPRLADLDPASIGILARLQDGAPACASRLTLWANVIHLISLHPWSGWGWGELDYAHFITLYPGARFCDILDNAHNLPLHLAVELGVPFALLACAAVFWLVLRCRPWQEANPMRQLAWAVLGLIFLHSMLEYPLWYGPFQIATALATWLLWVTRLHLWAPQSGMRGLLSTMALLVLLGAAYATWDYRRVSQLYLATGARAPAYRANTFEKVKDSRLFARQVRFAEFTTTDLTPQNAAYLNALAHDLLHFSPEARVAEKLIESAALLGRDEEVAAYLARYKAAFPAAHASWAKRQQWP